MRDGRIRRGRGCVWLGLAWGLVSCHSGGPAGPSRQPNVLLVTIDTLRADDLGCYGGAAPTSPAIDALSRQGAVFERAIAAASYTTPAVTSILTSLPPRVHSIGYLNNGRRHLQDEITLAEQLKHAGYQTAAFVSNPVLKRRTRLNKGFDHYDDELRTPELNRPRMMQRTAPNTTARVRAWLRQASGGPLFVWVHYQDPHGPYTPPRSFRQMFEKVVPSSEGRLRVLRNNFGLGGIPAYQVLPGSRKLSEYHQRYRGEIRWMDKSLGELVAAVRAPAGWPRPTIMVVTADHGESLGENNFFFAHGHATTPELCHVPLIVVAPGVRSQHRAEVVRQIDIMPTVLDLADVSIPAGLAGRSLVPALFGKPLPALPAICDAGHETAAYTPQRFLRARAGPLTSGLVGYYQSGRARADGRLLTDASAQVRRYGWWDNGTNRGSDATEQDAAAARALRAYWAQESPTPAAEISPLDAATLRALGYLPPEEEAE